MSISIMNRGASGGLKPELVVTAPSGSTIDLMQNGIIVSTYTLGSSATEHTFSVKVGTYTVRGILDNDEKSIDVIIDAVGRYTVHIEYEQNYTLVYYYGDEFTSLTGGWEGITGKAGNYPCYAMTKNTDHFYASRTGNNAWSCNMSTKNEFDFSEYSVASLGYYYEGKPVTYNYVPFVELTYGWVNFRNNEERNKGAKTIKGYGTVSTPSENGVITVKLATGLAVENMSGLLRAYIVVLGKPDNVDKLYSLAGVTPKASITELLQDESALTKIFSTQEAVKYAVRCNGEFMLRALDTILNKNNKFMNALNASSYKNIILQDSHWSKFINKTFS